MTNNIAVCPLCGRSITEYKHSINKTLVGCLARLNALGGRARLDALGLDNTHFNNFQKLRYFGLAIPTGENSEWQIHRLFVQVTKWYLSTRLKSVCNIKSTGNNK